MATRKLSKIEISRLLLHAFFYKKHNYKKHRPTLPKPLRNIYGYLLKPKKHFQHKVIKTVSKSVIFYTVNTIWFHLKKPLRNILTYKSSKS